MKVFFLACVCGLVSVAASAQTPVVGTERVAWDQGGATLASVQAYVYETQDGAAAPVAITNVTCAGTASPFQCSVRLPALTTGLHSLAVRASVVVNGQTLSSAFSVPLSLLIVAVPAVPQNVHIQ